MDMTKGLRSQVEETQLHSIVARIRQSLELPTILTAAAEEVRSLLGTDRIKIYQFHSDGSGKVIAESLNQDRLPSLLNLNFPADDIPPEARELFLKAGQRVIVDVAAGKMGVSLLSALKDEANEAEANEAEAEDIRYRPADPCHVEYLTTMQVQSSLVVPLLPAGELWGLLVSHHSEQYAIAEQELQQVQAIADQVSDAIAQANQHRQIQEQAERQTTLNRIISLLHSLPKIELQQALEETIAVFEASGGRLYIAAETSDAPGQLHVSGEQPALPGQEDTPIEQLALWRIWSQTALKPVLRKNGEGAKSVRPWAITDLYKQPQLRTVSHACQATPIRGLLIIPLLYDQDLLGYLTLFRNEVDTATVWAGKVDPDRRQLLPRQSFEAWCELKKGQCPDWTNWELDLAQELGTNFSRAVHYHQLYHQVQFLNTNLEHQVQERTAALKQSLSELQQTQAQLIQTEKMSGLGQLVAGIAHEINNPINFIYGNLEYTRAYANDLLSVLDLYQQKSPANKEIQDKVEAVDLNFLSEDMPKILDSMRVGANRIREIVTSLQNFSRTDQAGMKSVDIHEGIDSTLMILQHRLKTKSTTGHNIQIVKAYGDLPLVECYAGQLNQVFMNLLSNAIDALESDDMPASGRQITLRTAVVSEDSDSSVQTPYATIAIADNGPGMRESVRSRIFDPFFTTKPVGQGTGLGLTISYQIVVERHKGALHCTSQPDEGTEFRIEIPVKFSG